MKNRPASRNYLSDGSQPDIFLCEWLSDSTEAFFGNGAIKERLIYTYIEHCPKMVERSIGKARDSDC